MAIRKRMQTRSNKKAEGRLLAVASVNRMLNTLSHVFREAKNDDLIGDNPFRNGKSLLLKENNKQLRYLSEEEIIKLLNACKRAHVRNIVEFALLSGMRRVKIPYGRNTPNGVTFHTLRHTFASHDVIRGGKLEVLKGLLGHEDIKPLNGMPI